MTLLDTLKIITLFEICTISFLGFYTPIKFASQEFLSSDTFRILKSFSAGVIFGVGTLHLLNDAIEQLEAYSSYPLGLLCMVIGVFLTLCLEQISMHLLQEKETVLRKSVAADKSPLLSLLSSESNVIDAYRAESRSSAPSSSTPTLHPAISEFEVQFYETIRTSHLQKSLVKGILLEVSVAIHSIIIGFDLGSLDSQATLEILMVAFAFHQFFEGISLGTALSETHLPSWVKFLFALNFALTFPLGVIIGMLASSSADTSTVEIIQGCANGIASGSLIYTALVEMISEDFAEESLLSRWHVKGQMMLAVAFGVAGMAILAVWA